MQSVGLAQVKKFDSPSTQRFQLNRQTSRGFLHADWPLQYGSGRIWAALLGGPVIIAGVGCPRFLPFLGLFCPFTQGLLTRSIVLHLASKRVVVQPFFLSVKFVICEHGFRP